MRGVAIKRLEGHGTIRSAKIDANAEFRVRHRSLSDFERKAEDRLPVNGQKSVPVTTGSLKLRFAERFSEVKLRKYCLSFNSRTELSCPTAAHARQHIDRR